MSVRVCGREVRLTSFTQRIVDLAAEVIGCYGFDVGGVDVLSVVWCGSHEDTVAEREEVYKLTKGCL
jgi:glutathione synthase/RimK-type ligase-like ATP-grasp enzyme